MKKLVRDYPAFLLFGIFQVFFTAPGQTFLIAIFLPEIQAGLGISATALAGVYSSATLSASLLLNPVGRLIDRVSVQTMLLGSTTLFALGCVLLSLSQTIGVLFAAFFLLRLFGQGVFTLIAGTLLSKSFQKNRGAVLGVITLGYPLSEVIYPTLALWLLATMGWREAYGIFAGMVLVVMLPLQLFLNKHTRYRIGQFLPEEMDVQPMSMHSDPPEGTTIQKQYTVKEVLKDPSFYMILTASCFPPLIMTGLFFYQDLIFQTQGWPISLAATGVSAYAVAKALGSVVIGPILDKRGPLGPFMGLILLLAAGTFLVSQGGGYWTAYVYFAFMGWALGMSAPVMTVIWAQLYGTQNLGSIRGMIGTVRNGCTAFAPLPMAWALSAGYAIQEILHYQALSIAIVALLPLFVNRLRMKP